MKVLQLQLFLKLEGNQSQLMGNLSIFFTATHKSDSILKILNPENTVDEQGNTFLHQAAINGNQVMIQTSFSLLNIQLHSLNLSNETALHCLMICTTCKETIR
jgi:ankyrin repeat protein